MSPMTDSEHDRLDDILELVTRIDERQKAQALWIKAPWAAILLLFGAVGGLATWMFNLAQSIK